MHDPRIGRFFAIDPLAPKYPWYTPYQFSGNRPIDCVELEGLEPEKVGQEIGQEEMAQEGSKGRIYTYTWTQVTSDIVRWERGKEYTQATPEEASQIANHVYNLDKPDYDPGNGQGEDKLNGYSLISEIATPSTGFKAGLYRKIIDGVSFYVHATAGTDDFNDVIQDLCAGIEFGDVQIFQSLIYASGTNEIFKNDKNARSLIYTGHSLGGGLAAANAKKFNHQAITFNAMGVGLKLILYYGLKYKPTINAYIIKNEVLDKLQVNKANGRHIYVQPKGTQILTFNQYALKNNIKINWYNCGYYTTQYSVYTTAMSLSNHSMDNFLKYDF